MIASSSSPGLTAKRVFLTQYIALMLIIVCFVAAAFVRPVELENQQNKIQEELVELTLPIAKIDLLPAFAGAGEELKEDVLWPLLQLLRQHDVLARITIFPKETPGATSHFPEAVARSVTLARYLVGQGIPADAFVIEAGESDLPQKETLLAEIHRGERYE